MSDPPSGEQPPINQPIPGLSEQVSRLSEIASRAGYRLDSVVLIPNPTAISSPLPPPTITFTNPMPSAILPPPTTTRPTPLETTTAPVHESPKQPTRPLSAPSAITNVPSHPAPKRPSAFSLEQYPNSPHHSPSQPKRPRVSRSEIPSSQRRTAFWGTVLGQRSGDPSIFTTSTELQAPSISSAQTSQPFPHSQHYGTEYLPRIQPPLVGPSLSNLPTTVPQEETRALHRPQAQPYVQPRRQEKPEDVFQTRTTEQDFGTLKRVPTLPHVPTRSVRLPETPSPPVQSLPSLQRSFSTRHPTISGLLHRTGSFLSRVSPFTASSLPAQSIQQPPVAAPPILPTMGRNLELLEQRDLQQSHGLESFQSIQRQSFSGPPIRSPSHSQSASASNVSQARPASIPTSPRTPSLRAGERNRGVPTVSAEIPSTMMATPPQFPSGRGRRPSAQQAASGSQLFSCPLCDAKFGRKSDKTRHVRVVHDKSRPFVCALCGKKFGEKSNMLKHRASVHDDVRIFRCPYCDMSFSQRAMCDSHVRSVHDKKQAKYFCEQCGLPFSRKLLLHDHYAKAHPSLLQAYRQYEAASADAEAAEANITMTTGVVVAGAAAASSSGASARRSGAQSGGEAQQPSQTGDDFNEDEITPVYPTQQRQRQGFSGYGQPSQGHLHDTDDAMERSGGMAPEQFRQVYGHQAVESLLQQGLPTLVQAEGMDLPRPQVVETRESESIPARRQMPEEPGRTHRLQEHREQAPMGSTVEAIEGIERTAHHARQYAQQQAYQQASVTQQAQPQQSQSRIQKRQRRRHAEQSDSEDNSGRSVR